MTQFLGILSGVGAMFGWGISNFFAAKASKERGAPQTAFLSSLLSLSIVGGAYFVFGREFDAPLWVAVLVAGTSFAAALAVFSFFQALVIGPVSITSPIASSYALVTVIISVTLLGEALSANQWLAISLTLLGISLSSIHLEKLSVRIPNKKGVLLAFFAMIFWGISFAPLGIAVERSGWFMITLLRFFFLVLWFTIIFVLKGLRFRELWGSGPDRNIAANSIFVIFGLISFNFGLEHELTSIVTPISSASPAITVLLALTNFREHIHKNQILGVILIILGLVLLALK